MSRTRKTAPKTPQDARTFVSYYRVSTARQGESGLGLDAQRTAVNRYLAQAANAELVAEYTEVESGKRHTNRPQLAAAIAHAKRTHSTLIIAELDRLARNVHFISGLMESAADFVACDMPHANRLTIHILRRSPNMSEMISARTKAALEQVRARGVKLRNPRWKESIGKAAAGRRKIPTPSAISTIVYAYRKEGLSLRVIAGRLNELGIKAPTGSHWHPSSVRATLLTLEPRMPKVA